MSELAKRLLLWAADDITPSDLVADLLAAAKAVEEGEWRGIASAPKNEYVDIWAAGRRIPNAIRMPIALSSPIWRWWSIGGMVLEEPTHWRPIPAPPEVTR